MLVSLVCAYPGLTWRTCVELNSWLTRLVSWKNVVFPVAWQVWTFLNMEDLQRRLRVRMRMAVLRYGMKRLPR